MIRIEFEPKRGQVTMHLDGEGIDNLIAAAEDARPGNKVFLGEEGAMLILRPVGFDGAELVSDSPTAQARERVARKGLDRGLTRRTEEEPDA